MRIIAIVNQKGGVGKTTTTVNLAVALAKTGQRVLAIDIDPQANLSTYLGIAEPDQLPVTLADVLQRRVNGSSNPASTMEKAILETPLGVDLVPSSGALGATDIALASTFGREFVLRDCLAPIRSRYDFILLDCLPTFGLLVVNALAAADAVVIPVQAEYLAMQGLARMLESVLMVRQRLNPSLAIDGILLTMVDARTRHSQQVVSLVRETFAGRVRVFDTMIRRQVALRESSKAGQSILDYDPSSEAAAAYRALAADVLTITAERPAPSTVAEPGEAVDGMSEVSRRAVFPTPADREDETTVARSASPFVAAPAGASTSLDPMPFPLDEHADERPMPVATEPDPTRNGGLQDLGLADFSARLALVARAEPDDAIVEAASSPSSLEGEANPEEKEEKTGLKPDDGQDVLACPMLGLANRRERRRSRPDVEHRCFSAEEPLPIALSQQQNACFDANYKLCPRYLRAAAASRGEPVGFFGRVIRFFGFSDHPEQAPEPAIRRPLPADRELVAAGRGGHLEGGD